VKQACAEFDLALNGMPDRRDREEVIAKTLWVQLHIASMIEDMWNHVLLRNMEDVLSDVESGGLGLLRIYHINACLFKGAVVRWAGLGAPHDPEMDDFLAESSW